MLASLFMNKSSVEQTPSVAPLPAGFLRRGGASRRAEAVYSASLIDRHAEEKFPGRPSPAGFQPAGLFKKPRLRFRGRGLPERCGEWSPRERTSMLADFRRGPRVALLSAAPG